MECGHGGIEVKVKDVMTDNPLCTEPDRPVTGLAKIMCDEHCGSVPVVDPATMKPVGMVTDRDILHRVVAQDLIPSETRAKDCMSSPAIVIDENADVEEARRLMRCRNVGRLIIVTGFGAVSGIASRRDLHEKIEYNDQWEHFPDAASENRQ